jgi:hypothetical protein
VLFLYLRKKFTYFFLRIFYLFISISWLNRKQLCITFPGAERKVRKHIHISICNCLGTDTFKSLLRKGCCSSNNILNSSLAVLLITSQHGPNRKHRSSVALYGLLHINGSCLVVCFVVVAWQQVYMPHYKKFSSYLTEDALLLLRITVVYPPLLKPYEDYVVSCCLGDAYCCVTIVTQLWYSYCCVLPL